MAERKKVPEYTAKAIEKYHAKFDRIAVSLPKGSKDWIKDNTGKSCNAFFNELFQRYREEHAAADHVQRFFFVSGSAHTPDTIRSTSANKAG